MYVYTRKFKYICINIQNARGMELYPFDIVNLFLLITKILKMQWRENNNIGNNLKNHEFINTDRE